MKRSLEQIERLMEGVPAIGKLKPSGVGDPTPTLNVRQVAAGFHYVVDILRKNERAGALVVCIVCGATWDEGGYPPESCK